MRNSISKEFFMSILKKIYDISVYIIKINGDFSDICKIIPNISKEDERFFLIHKKNDIRKKIVYLEGKFEEFLEVILTKSSQFPILYKFYKSNLKLDFKQLDFIELRKDLKKSADDIEKHIRVITCMEILSVPGFLGESLKEQIREEKNKSILYNNNIYDHILNLKINYIKCLIERFWLNMLRKTVICEVEEKNSKKLKKEYEDYNDLLNSNFIEIEKLRILFIENLHNNRKKNNFFN